MRRKPQHARAEGLGLGVDEDARVAREAQGGAVGAAQLFDGFGDDGFVDLREEEREGWWW